MAIKNPSTGEYIKVTGFQADFPAGNLNIQYLKFANLEQRIRYDSGLGEFEIFITGQYNGFGYIENAMNTNADNNKSVKDNLLSACYSALKSDLFSSWEDS